MRGAAHRGTATWAAGFDRNSKVAVIPNGAWDKARHFEREVEGSGITVIVFNDVLTAGAWLSIEAGTAATILGQLRAEMADTAR